VSTLRLDVLGGCGVWPEAGRACSGYLVEHEGYRLLLDPGYGVVPQLLSRVRAADVDAVLVTHGHPDHCADLSPLLRARALGDDPPPPLPVYALPGALDVVLALDRRGMLDDAFALHDLPDRGDLAIGPFQVRTALLPHSRPNVGVRVSAGATSLCYTGDTGPSPEIAVLARGVDLLLAEATYVDAVPDDSRTTLSSARQAGEDARDAGVGRLLLTHLFPGTDPDESVDAARTAYDGPTAVATTGLGVALG
jgi:ribonuclease BN (tRNA processing enzyme)